AGVAAMVIPIPFAVLLISMRLHPAAILAPERNVLWVLAPDVVHATCERTTRFGTSCVRSTAREYPATATDLRAAARPVFRRATRCTNRVSALSQTRCSADLFRPAICRFACAPLKYSSPFHCADRGRASARYPSAPCRRVWRGFARP